MGLSNRKKTWRYALKDRIIRGITHNAYVRFFAVDATQSVQEAVKLHDLSITNSVVMGRMLSAALMMGTDLKSEKDVITLQIESDGIASGLVVTSKGAGNVKGFMPRPTVETPPNPETNSIDVKSALGNGVLKIIKELGLKTAYSGNVELLYGEIAQDLTYYYAQSEQVPTSIGLGVLIFPDGKVKKAGGFMIQLLPNTPESVIDRLEDNLNKFPNMTDMMDMGYEIEELIAKFILKDMAPKVLDTISASYKCDCSHERFKHGLRLLDKSELEKAVKDGEVLEANCHFCNKNYHYGKSDIEEILRDL